jgi:hypothetical protein
VSAKPQRLPANVLLGDSITGSGPQVFRLKVPDGDYRTVLLRPDGASEPRPAQARGGVLDIAMPGGEWTFSGLLVQGGPERKTGARWPNAVARPALEHAAVKHAAAGKPLVLALRVWPVTQVTTVRLHYRPLNQLATWKWMDAPPQRPVFTIPGDEVDARWDLQYYFEVLNSEGTGWFVPDPALATPYNIVTVEVDTAPLPEMRGDNGGRGRRVPDHLDMQHQLKVPVLPAGR